MTDGTDAPQEKEHAVRLLSSSPDDIFAAADFKEILSPMVEPEDVADHQTIEALLQELGLLSSRTTTNHKLAVLMSSFLLQSIRLEGRRDRTGSPMVLGFPHTVRCVGVGALALVIRSLRLSERHCWPRGGLHGQKRRRLICMMGLATVTDIWLLTLYQAKLMAFPSKQLI